MLVHIREVSPLADLDEWDYDNSKFVAAQDVTSYDLFVRFIQTMKENEKDILVDGKWYSVIDYTLCFPTESGSLLCLYVYVCEL